MPEAVGELLPLVAYIITVAVAAPVTVITLFLARRRLLEPMLTATLGSVTLFALLGIGTLAALISVDAGIQALQTAVVTGLVLVIVPLGIGTVLVRAVIGCDRDRALRVVIAGWPIALVCSVLLFVAPGGLNGTDVTTMGGLVGQVAFLAWSVLVLLGPTAVGMVVYTFRGAPGLDAA
jgi:hypothetical protein